MTLPLPPHDPTDPSSLQFIIDTLAKQFPIQGQSLGINTFIGVDGVRQRHIAFGTETVTWPGGSAVSNTITVAHNLPLPVADSPNFICVTAGLTSNHMTFRHPTGDNVEFTFVARTTDGVSPPNTQEDPVYWLAIG